MPTSIFLAKLIGPILVIAGIGVLANRKVFLALGQEIIRSHALVYLFGLIDLTVGLAIVLTHNVWAASWPLIITLLGWLCVIRGTVRVLAPEQVKAFGAKLLKQQQVVTGNLAATIGVGAVLCYFGYAR